MKSEDSWKVPSLKGGVESLPPLCRKDLQFLNRFIHSMAGQCDLAPAVSPEDFREVLLTGANGFIGRYVLYELLKQREDLVVHCLVRGRDEEHARERLKQSLEESEIWDEAWSSRIKVFVGDIQEPRLGLEAEKFDDLCERLDAVYHFAAELNLTSSYMEIAKKNTLSLCHLLEFCFSQRYKPFFFASTLGVFPEYIAGFGGEYRDRFIDHQMQPDLDLMKKMFPLGFMGYPWSKLVVEQALLQAQAAGLPVGIFRFPQTCMASSGFSQPSDLLVRLSGAVVESGVVPEGFQSLISESVDTLSQVCVFISLNPKRKFTVYQLCNRKLNTYRAELGDFGVYLPEVPYEVFKSTCQSQGEKSPVYGLWTLIDQFAPYWFSKNKCSSVLPVCDLALREDGPPEVRWPGPMTMYRCHYEWSLKNKKMWPYSLHKSHLDFDKLIEHAQGYAQKTGVSFEEACPGWMQGEFKATPSFCEVR